MGNKDSDKTKQYKIKAEKQPKNKKEGKKKGKKKHSKLKKAILICFVLVVLLGLAGVGVVAGIFLSDKWTLAIYCIKQMVQVLVVVVLLRNN